MSGQFVSLLISSSLFKPSLPGLSGLFHFLQSVFLPDDEQSNTMIKKSEKDRLDLLLQSIVEIHRVHFWRCENYSYYIYLASSSLSKCFIDTAI